MKNGILIKFDLQDTIDEFKLTKPQVDLLVNAAAEALTLEIHRNWAEAAKRGLNQTRDGYIRSLSIIDNGIGNKSIILMGKFPNMLEYGAPPFDMKEGFKNSSKVKFNKKGGWYLTIPFRMATPNAGGFSSVFSGVMPQAIYDIVKSYGGASSNLSTGKITTNPVQRLGTPSGGQIPSPYDELRRREKISVINRTPAGFVHSLFEEYQHKSSIYAGMQRDDKFYESTGQSTYNTFRRVGQNSDPVAWIHKGIQMHDFASQALANTNSQLVVDNIVDGTLAAWGFGQ